ncbi:hypothetical protein AS9A_1658 [Hoyosella subflava DQS3-9A1]|uniref:Uncharacterized protein n=1 Tax=Hoyosella subflava (strain DSM 45089 / JCM 17490 / NBRC 109087 / DQS3-9A1) TaxID=443218 RepID=F6EJT2_HOYSD|nr:hypothetical protein AS9A_1658 [Hoyosella subflava DQS3-9A1]
MTCDFVPMSPSMGTNFPEPAFDHPGGDAVLTFCIDPITRNCWS